MPSQLRRPDSCSDKGATRSVIGQIGLDFHKEIWLWFSHVLETVAIRLAYYIFIIDFWEGQILMFSLTN